MDTCCLVNDTISCLKIWNVSVLFIKAIHVRYLLSVLLLIMGRRQPSHSCIDLMKPLFLYPIDSYEILTNANDFQYDISYHPISIKVRHVLVSSSFSYTKGIIIILHQATMRKCRKKRTINWCFQ